MLDDNCHREDEDVRLSTQDRYFVQNVPANFYCGGSGAQFVIILILLCVFGVWFISVMANRVDADFPKQQHEQHTTQNN